MLHTTNTFGKSSLDFNSKKISVSQCLECVSSSTPLKTTLRHISLQAIPSILLKISTPYSTCAVLETFNLKHTSNSTQDISALVIIAFFSFWIEVQGFSYRSSCNIALSDNKNNPCCIYFSGVYN